MKRRGSGLLELTLAGALLSVGLLVCFALFEQGTRAFLLGNARAGLEGDARRILLSLQSDLRRGDMARCSVVVGRVALDGTSPRGAYSLAELSRWDQGSGFTPTGDVNWDRFQVVYATRTSPAQLVVQYYQPPPGPPYQTVMPGFTQAACLNDDPRHNLGATGTTVLSSSVESFEVTRDPSRRPCVTIRLLLAKRGGRKSGRQALDERQEALLTTRLENSSPFE